MADQTVYTRNAVDASTDAGEASNPIEINRDATYLSLATLRKDSIGCIRAPFFIPNGAYINSAYIEVMAGQYDSGALDTVISAWDVDDASSYDDIRLEFSSNPGVTVGTTQDFIDAVDGEKTTATVAWAQSTWVQNTWMRSPDISSIIQELVNRAGWVSTSPNGISFFFDSRATSSSTSERITKYDDVGNSMRVVVNFTANPPAPTITSIAPNNGPDTGGTSVTITGTGFDTSTVVTIGGNPCSNIVVTGSTTITCVTPAGTAGSATMTVTDGIGQTATGTFTYNATTGAEATITNIIPTEFVANTDGQVAQIIGTNFEQYYGVVNYPRIAVTNADATKYTWGSVQAGSSNTIMNVTMPNLPAGTYDVWVQNFRGPVTTVENAVTYTAETADPPTITGGGISPATGTDAGGTLVTITGTDFQQGATITFDALAATEVVWVASTTLKCRTPAHAAGAVDVVVTNPDTQSDTEVGGFTYTATPAANPPSITPAGIAPATGPEYTQTAVTITGTDFVSGAQVFFGANLATGVVVTGGTSITCNTPMVAAATVDVSVRNPDGQTDTESNGFEFTAVTYNAPDLSSAVITPDSGPYTGGTGVVLTGATDLRNGCTVTVGGAIANTVTFISDTSISFNTPAGTVGAEDVVVTNPDAQADTMTDAFTYFGVTSSPAISSIEPEIVGTAGGMDVLIIGSGFVDGATVTVCGVEASVTFISSTRLIFKAPPNDVGVCSVTVTNPDAGTSTLPDSLTYVKTSDLVCRSMRERQTVLTGLKVIRKWGEFCVQLPTFDTLAEAMDEVTGCLQAGDFYQTSEGIVMVVPGEVPDGEGGLPSNEVSAW